MLSQERIQSEEKRKNYTQAELSTKMVSRTIHTTSKRVTCGVSADVSRKLNAKCERLLLTTRAYVLNCRRNFVINPSVKERSSS